MAGVMTVYFLLQIVVWICLTLGAGVAAGIVWHRWMFPRGKERTVAFFHPYCASGGGGERVLWAIIQALGEIDQEGLSMKVLIYTVDPPSEGYRRGQSVVGLVVMNHRRHFSLELSWYL